MKKKELNLCLCEGRHEIPQASNGAIFGNTIDMFNPVQLEVRAFNSIWDKCLEKNLLEYASSKYPELVGTEEEDSFCIPRELHINLYVTGLTVALVAVLNVCREEGIFVTLWHYDRETGGYYPQTVK